MNAPQWGVRFFKTLMTIQTSIRTIQGAMARWFAKTQRTMPWRGSRDPYAIWVSEIMLQQTQVETVRPYFLRFMRSFPDVQALARAPLGRVLKAWEGLGYYSRARNLHRAARLVVKDLAGRLPDSAAALRKLPGIGPYTAGAIASIAFGQEEPALDGNVARVLCRVFCIRQNPKKATTQRKLWGLAKELVTPGRTTRQVSAGIINQALMDLGAMVCVPRRPRCDVCPLGQPWCLAPTVPGTSGAALCVARQRGEQDRLPVRAKRKAVPHYDIAVGLIWRKGRVLIDRRKPEGLLGGLWEFPGGKRRWGESLKAALRREVREELVVGVRVGRPFMKVRHAYSHFRITIHVFECRLSAPARPAIKALGCAAWRWARVSDLGRYAFPAANQKILAAMRRDAHPSRRDTPAAKSLP